MDTVAPGKRSWTMAQVRSNGNKSTEGALIRMMRREGIKGWRRGYPLFGSPDFVFPRERVAVFVDGCFWHGHPVRCRIPATNTAYWEAKIGRNKARDRRVTRALRARGWQVVRIWEHLINQPRTIRRLLKALGKHEH